MFLLIKINSKINSHFNLSYALLFQKNKSIVCSKFKDWIVTKRVLKNSLDHNQVKDKYYPWVNKSFVLRTKT